MLSSVGGLHRLVITYSDLVPIDPVLLVVYTLALASLTRLVTGMDSLTEKPVEWFIGLMDRAAKKVRRALDNEPGSSGWVVARACTGLVALLTKLITCVWCVSFWLALIIIPVMWHHGTDPVVYFGALALAMRFAAGYLLER